MVSIPSSDMRVFPSGTPESRALPATPSIAGATTQRYSSEVDSLSSRDWDRLVSDFDDFHLFQTAAFADELRGSGRMSHLVLRRGEAAVAGARVALMRLPGFPTGVAYIKYGPFWRRTGSAPDAGVYRALLAALIDEYGRRRGHMISISARPHPTAEIMEEQLLRECGFVLRSRLKRPISFFLVNTGAGQKALRDSLSQSWRRNLKIAERSQLEIRFRDPMEALPDFLALEDAMVARKQLTRRDPLHTLPGIFENLPPSCSHIVTASRGREVVAGAVVIVGGDVGYYLYGASADAALELRAGYALHWEIARWLKERGIAWYDLGDGFSGLRQFKEGFVGKSGATIERSGEFDWCPGPQARAVGELVYGARSLAAVLRRWNAKLGSALQGRPN